MDYNKQKKINPTLFNVVMDPSVFGGPRTYKNIVDKNQYLKKYNDFIHKNGQLVMDIYRSQSERHDWKEVIYHFQIPSESNPDVIYDTLIRFYTNDSAIAAQSSLANYNLQIFSNSPGFTFQYAYVYNKRKILYDRFAGLINPEALKTPPNKSNPSKAVGYDYTVFFSLYHLRLNNFYIRKDTILQYGKDISQLNPDDIPSSEETLHKRNPEQLISFNKIKRKVNKVHKDITQKFTSLRNNTQKFLGITNKGKTKMAKAKKATHATKARSGRRKRGFFN